MAAELVLTMDPPESGNELTVDGTGFDGTNHASLTTALTGANNDLVYTAVNTGIGGNGITVAYVDPGGATAALSVAVVGSAITVNLARASSAITSTAAQIAAAIAASAPAHALVTVANAPANDGTGIVTALTATHLAGATDAGTVDVAIHGPDESFVLDRTVDTDGSGNFNFGENIEVEQSGVVHVKAVSARDTITSTIEVFSIG